jgi:hypothetical protein
MSEDFQFRSTKVLDYLKIKGQIDSFEFFDLVGIMPHEGQRKVINAYSEKIMPSEETEKLGLQFDYKYKTIIAACGRRFGKSFFSSVLAAEELLYPYAQVLVCSYRLENCKVIFRQVREIIKKLKIEIVSDRQKDLELELGNGSKITVASNDNVEARLGNSCSLIIIDEAKLFHRELYETFLEPQLLDYSPYSRTIMISSPQEGWLYDYYLKGQSDDPIYSDFWSISLPSSTNPTNSKEALAKLKARIPADIWEQEYEGKFISAAGKVYAEFDRNFNVFNDESEPTFWAKVHSGSYPLFHTIDSGYTHCFAGMYVLHDELSDTFYVFGEYNKAKVVTPVHADNFKQYEKDYGLDVYIRYADPAAAQQIADFAEYDFYFNKAKKNMRETVNCVNTLFFQLSKTSTKDRPRPRLMIHEECYELIRQLNTCMWKTDVNDQTRETSAGSSKPFKPDTDKKTDWDLLDALRYGLYSHLGDNLIDISICSTETGDEVSDDDANFRREMMMSGFYRVGSALEED